MHPGAMSVLMRRAFSRKRRFHTFSLDFKYLIANHVDVRSGLSLFLIDPRHGEALLCNVKRDFVSKYERHIEYTLWLQTQDRRMVNESDKIAPIFTAK